MATIATFTTDTHETHSIVTPVGQIDETNLPELEKTCEPLVGGARYLVFDLAGLTFINSKVIGYLASLHSQLDEQEQVMIFANPNEHIFDIIELVGLTQIVPTYDSMDEALRAIATGEVSTD